jgi:hypothetical protein
LAPAIDVAQAVDDHRPQQVPRIDSLAVLPLRICPATRRRNISPTA